MGFWGFGVFVEDENYWNDVVMSGDFKGFSLEGMFSERLEETIVDEVYSKIEKIMEHPDEDYVFDEIKKVLKIK